MPLKVQNRWRSSRHDSAAGGSPLTTASSMGNNDIRSPYFDPGIVDSGSHCCSGWPCVQDSLPRLPRTLGWSETPFVWGSFWGQSSQIRNKISLCCLKDFVLNISNNMLEFLFTFKLKVPRELLLEEYLLQTACDSGRRDHADHPHNDADGPCDKKHQTCVTHLLKAFRQGEVVLKSQLNCIQRGFLNLLAFLGNCMQRSSRTTCKTSACSWRPAWTNFSRLWLLTRTERCCKRSPHPRGSSRQLRPTQT